MRVTPLALHSGRAIAASLRSHGWEPGESQDAAGGLEPAAFHFSDITDDVRQELARYAGKIGLELLSGDGWVILAGSYSRLGALARPWVVPPALAELANALGRAMPGAPDPFWQTARGPVRLDRPVIMGILNVTPDSFSDGGHLRSVADAVAAAQALFDAGADIVDVGGESTRPGRTARVNLLEESARVVPVVEAIVAACPDGLVSVDTMTAQVARAALDEGVAIVNDVSGGRVEPELLGVVAAARAGLVLMHSRGLATDLAEYGHADYGGDTVGTVLRELEQGLGAATKAGIAADHIVLDPGLGFAKTPRQTLELLDELAALRALGRPLLVGPSRKRFLGEVTGLPAAGRDGVTAVACALAYERGARLFRVHDAASARAALQLAAALRAGDHG